MFDFTGPQGTLYLVYKAQYAKAPTSISKVELIIKHATATTVTSDPL